MSIIDIGDCHLTTGFLGQKWELRESTEGTNVSFAIAYTVTKATLKRLYMKDNMSEKVPET